MDLMRSIADMASLKQVSLRKQPLFGGLIREMRSLSNLTQEQFAAVIGVSYVTISRWESGRIQPSELALRQVHAFLERLSQSKAHRIQERSKELLALYLAGIQR
jgi:DNA-binding transcriptional regulator YiaG